MQGPDQTHLLGTQTDGLLSGNTDVVCDVVISILYLSCHGLVHGLRHLVDHPHHVLVQPPSLEQVVRLLE